MCRRMVEWKRCFNSLPRPLTSAVTSLTTLIGSVCLGTRRDSCAGAREQGGTHVQVGVANI